MFACKYVSFPAERVHLPRDWPLALTQPLIAAAILGLMLLRPAFYRKHQRGIGVMAVGAIPVTARQVRAGLLWMKFVDASGSVQSKMQMLRFFFTENVHLLAAVDIVVAFPVGQIPELLLSSLLVLLLMAGNQYICTLPKLAENLVTMTPRLLSVTEAASMWMSGLAAGSLGISPPVSKLSCPAVFGFWQVVGGVLACLLVFVADILRRRAFLRTPETLAYLGRAHKAAALSWPFQGLVLLQRGIVIGVLAVIMSASLIWDNALYFLV